MHINEDAFSLGMHINDNLFVPGKHRNEKFCLLRIFHITVFFTCSAPPAPGDLQMVRRSSASLTLSWLRPQPPNGNITLYRVMYWELNSTGANGIEWRSNSRYVEYTLTGLKPFTEYQVQVCL